MERLQNKLLAFSSPRTPMLLCTPRARSSSQIALSQWKQITNPETLSTLYEGDRSNKSSEQKLSVVTKSDDKNFNMENKYSDL